MKTLSQLIQEASTRLEKKMGLTYEKQDLPEMTFETLGDLRAFFMHELETIVKESFKNTRVEESYMRDVESSAYNTALLDIEAKQNQFLNN